VRYSLLVLFVFTVASAASSQTPATQRANTAHNTPNVSKESASEVADKFLGGAKIIELPEGKKAVTQTMWPIRFRISFSTPVFNRYTTVFEGLFDTDVSGVEGYKRIVDIEGRNEAGTTLTTRFMLILYQDQTDKSWRVITFAKSQDVDHAVGYFRQITDQDKENVGYNYYILGLSLIDAGKLSEARETFKKSLSFAETEDSSKILSVPKDEVLDYLTALHSITSE
jgi:tetratricopeptide (TPR) repeat protein